MVSVQRPCDHPGEIQRAVTLLGVAGLRKPAECGQSSETGRAEAFGLDNQTPVELRPQGVIRLVRKPVE
ncbi:hypothetical protein [Dactylosporangium sp. NPDC050588]|uniref:hypothetical protein n=1 Tax=Dactylosporangium sp. NPDC050588 TaxID=3157211 RepID=UPI0033DFB641